MNPPTDPLQLLIYGVATILVVLALKLWDRRRDRRLQSSVDTAAQQATNAASDAAAAKEHAASAATNASAAPVVRAIEDSRAQIVQTGEGVEKSLIYLAERIGELTGQVRALERAVDLSIATEKVRRARDRAHS